MAEVDPLALPADLPVPADDGAADHLDGVEVPAIALPATDGSAVRLDRWAGHRVVVYAYPQMGRPGEGPVVPDWDAIPGARGCTPQACDFRDHHDALRAEGAAVFGLSTQGSDAQQEAVSRLHLPFPLLSDARLEFSQALGLPTFDAGGRTFLRRLTLVIRGGRVEHVWYPVFPPDRHAGDVVSWLRDRPAREE